MDWLNTILSGLGGAIITLIGTYIITSRGRERPTGKAYEILQKLGKLLEKPKGEYFFTKSATDNFNVAQLIYGHADGAIISTAFNENPKIYGNSDLIRGFKYGGSLVTRITCRDVCPEKDEISIKESMQNLLKGSSLLIVPRDLHITKIDGIFAKLSDDTYLTFIAFRNHNKPEKNRGVIFRDGIAKGFFEYYEHIIDELK